MSSADTDLREQVEQVFQRDGYTVMQSDDDVIPCRHSATREAELLKYIAPSTVSALCALLTPPALNREKLAASIVRYGSQAGSIFQLDDQGISCVGVTPKFLDLIVEWAQGMPPEPTWCKHMQWSEARQRWTTEDEAARRVILWRDDWTVCPICAAPRPATPQRGTS